jgi:diguanylate cyclase (GGDEF)-like protein
VVEWVRRFHPALSQALVPVVPPYVAQARLVKKMYPEDTAVVYASPCYARKDEIADPELAGAVDVAIDFFELDRIIASGRRKAGYEPAPECGGRRPLPVKELSLTDGFPRSALDGDPYGVEMVVTRGLHGLESVLRSIERGETGPRMVDMLSCEGCLDGPAVNPSMSVFAKRNIEARERQAKGRSVVSSRALLRHLPSVDLVRSFPARPLKVRVPSAGEVDSILAEGGFATRAETIDCGACGYKTCVEQAEAIWRGDSTWEMCFPLQKRLLAERVERLEAHSTLDELTGVWNRRMFAERLVDEVARFDRYRTPVSLLMVDIDGFSEMNERHGCEAGDRLLAAVAAELRRVLRVTDLVARYCDDTFAVLLPSQRKTAAFAVAEKVRAALAALHPAVAGEGYTTLVPVTVSVGVASAGEWLADATELIEAAESALIEAKESGRDQVRIAPDEG